LAQVLQVVLVMNIARLNIYKRLRDFKVPSSVLDEIFSNDKDLKILEDAFSALVDDGFKEDESAEEISKMILKELDIDPDQSLTEEK
jgi:helix-turn-helix protein